MPEADEDVRDRVAELSIELREKLHQLVSAEVSYRDLRLRIFGDDLFSDPAWDMLLALYQANLDDEVMTVSNVLSFSRCPDTTALRHLEKLINGSLAIRIADDADARRIHVALTKQGTSALEGYFVGPKNGTQ